MSIIIHGMDMPGTCCKCKMMVYGSEKVWAWVCLLTGELADNTKREEHCPLTELPPHGRLIDADVLIDMMPTIGDEYLYARETIEEAPTIIEAEEGERE